LIAISSQYCTFFYFNNINFDINNNYVYPTALAQYDHTSSDA